MSENKMTFEEFQILQQQILYNDFLKQNHQKKSEKSELIDNDVCDFIDDDVVPPVKKNKTKKPINNNSIVQSQVFGSTRKAFSLSKLRQLMELDASNDNHNFSNTKKYFLTYFAKSLDSIFYKYEPQENEEDGLIVNMETLKGIWDQIEDTISYKHNGASQIFNLKSWFMKSHHETFKINSDPRMKRFYQSKDTEQQYINLSKGFLHKNVKPYSSYSDKIKSNVEIILNHIKVIWNSKNEINANFCLDFLAHSLTGHKMNVALFLKSGEGTGKSVIVEFLINHVIGDALGLSTSRINQLMKFNSQLMGKLLVCLEELPTSSKSEWFSVSDYLKDLITGSKIDIEKKFADCVQTVNMMSLIIITNNENTIKFGKDARRYMMCDISHDMVGNTAYFNNLVNACNRETGEAFFMYLLERYESNKDFNPSQVPLTEAKKEMKSRNLTPILEYVKNVFISTEIGLLNPNIKHEMIKLNDLKDSINSKFNLKMSTSAFNIALKSDIPETEVVIYGASKALYIKPLNFEKLLKFYIKKGFWDSTNDRFEREIQLEKDEDESESNSDDRMTIVSFKLLYEKQIQVTSTLQNEIAQLKEQLAKLTEVKIVEIVNTQPTKSDYESDSDSEESDDDETIKRVQALRQGKTIDKPTVTKSNKNKK
jgi:hypothetical protein